MNAATVLVLAHFGHWYISGPVFLGPVVALIAYAKVAGWREHRKAAEEKPEKVAKRQGR